MIFEFARFVLIIAADVGVWYLVFVVLERLDRRPPPAPRPSRAASAAADALGCVVFYMAVGGEDGDVLRVTVDPLGDTTAERVQRRRR
jgi:hypothetical protein